MNIWFSIYTNKHNPAEININPKTLYFVIVSLNTYLPIKVVHTYVRALKGKTMVNGMYFKRTIFIIAPTQYNDKPSIKEIFILFFLPVAFF